MCGERLARSGRVEPRPDLEQWSKEGHEGTDFTSFASDIN